MKLQPSKTNNKAKTVIYAGVGVCVLLFVYFVFAFQTTASVTEVRKELTLHELR